MLRINNSRLGQKYFKKKCITPISQEEKNNFHKQIKHIIHFFHLKASKKNNKNNIYSFFSFYYKELKTEDKYTALKYSLLSLFKTNINYSSYDKKNTQDNRRI